MRSILGVLVCLVAAAVSLDAAPPAPVTNAGGRTAGGPSDEARRLLETSRVRGGLVVHLGCGDGRLTAALGAGASYLVHGLDLDPAEVAKARQHVFASGLYGRVSIDQWTGLSLPYIDNAVNLLVAEDLRGVSITEVRRVLAPNGVAFIKKGGQWTKIVKPRPADIDEWTHYLHDPSNNAVAHDAEIGPLRHLQWMSGPAWSRHHDHMASLDAMVSAGGRVFYIVDEGSRESILLPPHWWLVARDAFSGTLLWKRPIAHWNTQLWPLKSGPNQLPRRLVAVGDRVYVTLGIDAPVSVLDAATGKTTGTFTATKETDEILLSDGVLYLLVAEAPNKWKDYRPKFSFVWANTNRANKDWAWDKVPRRLMAVRADTGEVLWKKEHRVAPLTLGADRDRLYFYNGEKVVAVDRKTGSQRWTSAPVTHKGAFPTGYGPTLVVQRGVVLVSLERKSMTALKAADGSTLWTAPHHPGGHMSPDDMLVINGLVWSGAIANSADSGVFTGRDLQTGKVASEFLPDVNPPWFHHRCYRSRATDKYFIASRTGIEFIDLEAKHWDINHWVRGGCLYGFMPANGLLYVPPHDCGCFLESKLFHFNALAADSPSRRVPRDVSDQGRLERGPAYAQPVPAENVPARDEWPTYRHDALRSGAAKTAVPLELKRAWQVELGGKLSSVVVAGGKAFVAAIDRHTVHAFDANSGKAAWTYTAGGRIDSPPTIHQGRVLFGSADGWVYCLRAADGKLLWRFRAAPIDRRLVSYDQVESAWPVSGSVLVADGSVYCVAGRSAFLDGGLRLVRLDPKTGRKLSETLIDDRDPETGKNLQAKMKGQDMPVALPDILSCDGQSIYMRSQAFDLTGRRRHIEPLRLNAVLPRRDKKQGKAGEYTDVGNHLFSRSGFLDDSWYWRSYWIYGKGVDSNYGGWLQPGHFAPCGRLMVLGEDRLYGFGRQPAYLCNASVAHYYLYGADRDISAGSVHRIQKATRIINAASPTHEAWFSDWAVRKQFPLTDQNPAHYHWAEGRLPIRARAMVLADKTLLVAGPPDLLNEEEAFRHPNDPAVRAKVREQAASLSGRRGGQLLAVSAADGKVLAAFDLGAMPTFDGMAVAMGKVYLTTADGTLVCLGREGMPLGEAKGVQPASLDISIKPLVEPNLGPSIKAEFAKVVAADVTRSKLGCLLRPVEEKTGLALKKLPAPLSGKIVLKVRLKATTLRDLKNGFLVFGDAPEEARLIKCGPRFLARSVVIIQGPINRGKAVEKRIALNQSKVYELLVTVDLPSGQVTMTVGGATVTAKLDRPPAHISYVGYEALNAATDFGPIEIAGK